MSKLMPSRPRQGTQRRTFAIVASEYNREFVDGLVDHAQRELNEISHAFNVMNFTVPGAFEIPLVVQEIAAKQEVDAIIALGVIIEGETAHDVPAIAAEAIVARRLAKVVKPRRETVAKA